MVRAARRAAGGQTRGARLSEPHRTVRRRFTCRGTVQGVGFRPAVHRLATELGLAGWVRNAGEGAVIEVEGAPSAVREFDERLSASLPPLASLDRLDTMVVEPEGETSFSVLRSEAGRREQALVPPDAALCPDCRAEMDDPADRRHRYPFTTCTNCGPRFSLVRALPYDRERTAMSCFPLCPDCRREYEDPTDRRFHAEPVCCPVCGPRMWVETPGSGLRGPGSELPARPDDADAMATAREALERGEIVAVKALGGFQLACRADDEAAVGLLRQRKRRPSKPFAVMVRDLATARRLVALSAADEALLASPRSPVVLAPARAGASVAAGGAPGLDDLGVMIPTTPLHVELFREAAFDCLVMTSGNAADEPICRSNREALARLAGIADVFLLHDRDVVRRVDDSVVRSTPSGPVLVRRARGFVPAPLPLPCAAPRPILAMGPFLQATACLAIGEQALGSQHVGDLDSEPARAFLAEVVEGLEEFLQARGEVIVVDEHPDYPSTARGERLARERGAQLIRVQHHLAHAAAVLGEHRRFPGEGETALAIALDGTGWGSDGTAWGGEWLRLDGSLRWRRLAHLESLPLVGGEAAVREPWRVAAAALVRAGAAELLARLPLAAFVPPDRLAAIARLAEQPGWPIATGAGRVFEAAGALLGLAVVNGYEGEAAARLESLASRCGDPVTPWAEVSLGGPATGTAAAPTLPSAALLVAAARRLLGGEPPEPVAAGFHATFCRLAAELTVRAAPPGVATIALGGGCLVNRLLRSGLARGVAAAGFEPLLPCEVPPGDGGIAYGQAVLAAVAEVRGVRPELEGV